MKILIRVLLSILSLFVILLVIITSLFVINKFNGKITYIFGYTAFFNTGSSMEPKINPGDFLIIKKQNNYDVKDVISFISSDNYITTHRIIDIKDNLYVTKGDSNNYTDSTNVNVGNIYGKVVLIIPSVSIILNKLWQFKFVIIGVFLIPVIFIIRGKLCKQK